MGPHQSDPTALTSPQKLGASLQKVAVVLDADANPVFLAVIGAFPKVGRDPVLNLLSGITLGHGLPGLVSHLSIGEDANHRRAKPGGHFDPLLDVANTGVANRLIRSG